MQMAYQILNVVAVYELSNATFRLSVGLLYTFLTSQVPIDFHVIWVYTGRLYDPLQLDKWP